ncbi:MAG TPA: HAMP domain-containing sensor histidine kinase [Phycisphaerae bacterium]|nr:HAMP domain-containing sensor histidine kinase [Phycisphaerae bacterium]
MPRSIKISIQVKSVLILAVVVLLATTAGGWFYYAATRDILRHADHQQAGQLASGLALSAAPALAEDNVVSLHTLVNELLTKPKVQSAAVLDRNGRTVAYAERAATGFQRIRAVTQSPSLSYETHIGDAFLEVGQPVLTPAPDGQRSQLVGGVRLVLDTRPTAAMLAGLQREVSMVGALVVLLAIPLGQLLVWRVVAVPIRRLVEATRLLAQGDLSARVHTRRNDEIGALASSFDTMAGELQASQAQLRLANESLERKVAERTADLERANIRLREEMSEKEDFLRAVSHDLNAPLRNIAGMATMISVRHRQQLPEEVIARLQRIQANVDAGTDLLTELLELSRVKTRPQRRSMVHFRELLEDLRGTFEYELKAKGIELSIHEPMPTLWAERNRMRQVFQNLIDNAIKYMVIQADARIEVRYRPVGDMHEFHVTDNGPGVAPEDQERIFHVFRRAAGASQAGVPGKGVGLALVRSIAQNYDGRAWVQSQLGHGSDFCFALNARRTAPGGENPFDHQTPEKTEFADAGHPAVD